MPPTLRTRVLAPTSLPPAHPTLFCSHLPCPTLEPPEAGGRPSCGGPAHPQEPLSPGEDALAQDAQRRSQEPLSPGSLWSPGGCPSPTEALGSEPAGSGEVVGSQPCTQGLGREAVLARTPSFPSLNPQGRKMMGPLRPQMQNQDLGRPQDGQACSTARRALGSPRGRPQRPFCGLCKGHRPTGAWIPTRPGLSACHGKPRLAASPSCWRDQMGGW